MPRRCIVIVLVRVSFLPPSHSSRYCQLVPGPDAGWTVPTHRSLGVGEGTDAECVGSDVRSGMSCMQLFGQIQQILYVGVMFEA
jgi:hypothetical protein